LLMLLISAIAAAAHLSSNRTSQPKA
jgi:hypothetical protein